MRENMCGEEEDKRGGGGVSPMRLRRPQRTKKKPRHCHRRLTPRLAGGGGEFAEMSPTHSEKAEYYDCLRASTEMGVEARRGAGKEEEEGEEFRNNHPCPPALNEGEERGGRDGGRLRLRLLPGRSNLLSLKEEGGGDVLGGGRRGGGGGGGGGPSSSSALTALMGILRGRRGKRSKKRTEKGGQAATSRIETEQKKHPTYFEA